MHVAGLAHGEVDGRRGEVVALLVAAIDEVEEVRGEEDRPLRMAGPDLDDPRDRGRVEPHALDAFDRQVDALRQMWGAKQVMGVDELRRGIESIPEAEYHRLTYYRRWIRSITDNLLKKGVITDGAGKKVLSKLTISPNTVPDEFRAGGRIPLIIGRAVTDKARKVLGLKPTTVFTLPDNPKPKAKQACSLAQKMVGEACGVKGIRGRVVR